jgi:hypothetical protein
MPNAGSYGAMWMDICRRRLPMTNGIKHAAPNPTQAYLDFVAAEGRRWQHVHAEAFAKLSPGTTVIIEFATGEYVCGETWQHVEQAFEQRFGKIERLSYTFDVDRPSFAGGGLWQRSPSASGSNLEGPRVPLLTALPPESEKLCSRQQDGF